MSIITLSFFKTPLKHTPVIIVDGFYEDVSLKIILNQQPSLSFCNLVIDSFEAALSKDCVNCSIKKLEPLQFWARFYYVTFEYLKNNQM